MAIALNALSHAFNVKIQHFAPDACPSITCPKTPAKSAKLKTVTNVSQSKAT
jgi:hypothetical protein